MTQARAQRPEANEGDAPDGTFIGTLIGGCAQRPEANEGDAPGEAANPLPPPGCSTPGGE